VGHTLVVLLYNNDLIPQFVSEGDVEQ
jgi:hypothetical protein